MFIESVHGAGGRPRQVEGAQAGLAERASPFGVFRMEVVATPKLSVGYVSQMSAFCCSEERPEIRGPNAFLTALLISSAYEPAADEAGDSREKMVHRTASAFMSPSHKAGRKELLTT